jgi:hypothetical protein
MLEDALRSPEIMQVVNSILKQVGEWKEMTDPRQRERFKFRIPQALATKAQRDYKQALFAGESTQDANAETLYAALIGPLDTMAKVYVTKGRCPATNNLVMTRHIIGQDIELPTYENIVMSPDAFMTETYKPSCTLCTNDARGETVTHDTVLSFTRYMPRDLIGCFDAVDKAELAIQVLDGVTNYANARGAMKNPARKHVARRMEELIRQKAKAERKLSDALSLDERKVFWISSRIKGHERLTEKVVRVAIGLYSAGVYDISKIEPIQDIYGDQIIARNRLEALNAARVARQLIIFRNGPSAFRTSSTDPAIRPVEGEDFIYEMDKPGKHHDYRLHAIWGNTSPILTALQFQSYADHQIDQADHIVYEERQRGKVQVMRDVLPIDALRKELTRVFNI